MDVLTSRRVCCHPTYIMAVLEDSVSHFEIFQRDLVTKGDVILGFHLKRLLGIHEQTLCLLSGLDVYGGNPHRVCLFVHQKMNHLLFLP